MSSDSDAFMRRMEKLLIEYHDLRDAKPWEKERLAELEGRLEALGRRVGNIHATAAHTTLPRSYKALHKMLHAYMKESTKLSLGAADVSDEVLAQRRRRTAFLIRCLNVAALREGKPTMRPAWHSKWARD